LPGYIQQILGKVGRFLMAGCGIFKAKLRPCRSTEEAPAMKSYTNREKSLSHPQKLIETVDTSATLLDTAIKNNVGSGQVMSVGCTVIPVLSFHVIFLRIAAKIIGTNKADQEIEPNKIRTYLIKHSVCILV
jgi:hypothetical protein